MSFFCYKAMELKDFAELFEKSDETKQKVMFGLIEEAFDCKTEIIELKKNIRELKERNAKFIVIAKRERLLVQKRASYTNMMARICKELCAVNDADDLEDLEEYE